MKKIKYIILSVVAILSIACSSDDNNQVDNIEQITVIKIDPLLLNNIEWINSKNSYVDKNFKIVKKIPNIQCPPNKIQFEKQKFEIYEFIYLNECISNQYNIDYYTRGNQIISEDLVLYTVMTLNEDRLVLLQEVNPTDKNTPVGAKYIKKEYFRYKGNN